MPSLDLLAVYMFLYSIYCRKWDTHYQLRKIKLQITNFLSRQKLNVQYRCGSCNRTSESIRIIFCVVSKVDILMYLINWMNVDRRVVCCGWSKGFFIPAVLCIFSKKKKSLITLSTKAISNLVWIYSWLRFLWALKHSKQSCIITFSYKIVLATSLFQICKLISQCKFTMNWSGARIPDR